MPVAVLDVHNEFSDYVRRAGREHLQPKEGQPQRLGAGWPLACGKDRREHRDVQAHTRPGRNTGIQPAQVRGVGIPSKGIFQADEGTWGRTPPTMQDMADEIGMLLNSSRGAGNRASSGFPKGSTRCSPAARSLAGGNTVRGSGFASLQTSRWATCGAARRRRCSSRLF